MSRWWMPPRRNDVIGSIPFDEAWQLMPTNKHTPNNGKRSSTGPGPGAACESVSVLDALSHMMTRTVREAVFDWLEAHKAEVLEAFLSGAEFEAANRPLPYH